MTTTASAEFGIAFRCGVEADSLLFDLLPGDIKVRLNPKWRPRADGHDGPTGGVVFIDVNVLANPGDEKAELWPGVGLTQHLCAAFRLTPEEAASPGGLYRLVKQRLKEAVARLRPVATFETMLTSDLCGETARGNA